MRISAIHVTGFGRIDGLDLTGLDHPLVVIEGPNGSGKTSLMEFVSGVLTGFPRGSTRRRKYPPAGSAIHGGSLELTIGDQRVGVARHLPGNGLEVTGSSRASERIRETIATLSPGFYRGLLAFDVDALNHLELMSDREINDLVYGAGSSGSGVSPRRVAESLRARASEIYLPRGRRPALNRRIEELNRARTELRSCLDHVADTTGLRSRIVDLEDELNSLRSERNRLARERWRLETALSLWGGHVRAGDHQEAIHRILAEVPREVLGRVEGRRDAMEAALAQVRDLTGPGERVTELRARLLRLRSQAKESRALLGGDWTEERVRATIVPLAEVSEGGTRWSAVSEAAAELEGCRERLVEARRRLDAAVTEHDAARTAAGGRDRRHDPESVRDRARGIRALGDELINVERLLASAGPPRTGGGHDISPNRLRAAVAVAVAALGSLGGGWFLASGRAAPAVGLLALTVPLVLLVLGVISPRGDAHPGSDTDQLRRRHRELATRLRTEAGWIGVEPLPGSGPRSTAIGLDTLPVTAIINQADRLEREAAAVARAGKTVAEAHERLDSARRSAERAQSHHREAMVAWRCWIERLGLPGNLTGPAMDTFLTRLGEARRLQVEIEATEEEIADLGRRREEATGRLAALRAEVVPPGRGDADEGSADQRTALEELLRMSEELSELDSQLGEWSLRVREQAGDRTEEVLATLEENDPEGWRDRVERIDGEIPDVESAIERRAGELRSARDQLEHRERSAEIAERAQDVAILEDSAAELWNRYRALTTAARLVEETLGRHEARRQPEVVGSASARFTRVTAGAYTDLIVREGSVAVVDTTGREIAPAALSRGTVEQLYLSLRLALIETFVRRHPVPVVLDDVLVDFDPDRTAAMVTEIVSLSEETQVIFFTCHPATVEEFVRLAPRVRPVRLGPIGPGWDQSP